MKSLPHELLFTPGRSRRLEPTENSFSMECWREHNQNQQLQGMKLIFAKSELQPHVHSHAEAGQWIKRTID